jgi:hypothetical protein
MWKVAMICLTFGYLTSKVIRSHNREGKIHSQLMAVLKVHDYFKNLSPIQSAYHGWAISGKLSFKA